MHAFRRIFLGGEEKRGQGDKEKEGKQYLFHNILVWLCKDKE
jgi:hypothetical protein